MPPNALFDAFCILHSVTDIIARAAAIQARQSSPALQKRARVKFYERSEVGNTAQSSRPKNEPERTTPLLDTTGIPEHSSLEPLILPSIPASRTLHELEDALRSPSATLPLHPHSTSTPAPLPQSHILAHEKTPSKPPTPEPNIASLSSEVG